MQIIEQSYEFIYRGMPVDQLIELAGRTCYKSETKITPESADKFVKMLIDRGHFSVLEHATACFRLDPWEFEEILANFDTAFVSLTDIDRAYLISGNLRAFMQLVEEDAYDPAIMGILRNLIKTQPEMFGGFYHSGLEDYAPAIQLSEKDLTDDHEKLHHIFRTIKFITNRGVTHELVRHRPASFSMESTRYVNYGGSEMRFIKPVWYDHGALPLDCGIPFKHLQLSSQEIVTPEFVFLRACRHAESCYNELRDCNWRPEQAREVLPNSLKTEIVMTANLAEWHHVLTLRCSKKAHPQIRDLMIPVLADFYNEFPRLFGDLFHGHCNKKE
ncbi:MAG: FAD-dependent thymidylate synthase [Desulfobacterales bacterium]|nr:FAD-dependent thymidylate synthase [Desulfobacterales bacterium]